MYILEGNIGVGKSTFLSLITKHIPTLQTVPEPVDDWSKQRHGQSLLKNFYTDTPRWSYTLETMTMMSRVKNHIEAQEDKNPNRIMERSVYSGHYCFATNGFEMGVLTEMEWNIYNQWADFLIHGKCRQPLGFIYLQAAPEICFERVKKRNRSSESGLSLDYMKRIHARHEIFLVKKSGISAALQPVPVLILDCNRDFLENESLMNEHSSKLQTFLLQTQDLNGSVHKEAAQRKNAENF